MTIEQLQSFCSADKDHAWLARLFTIGEFTYAGDGHVMLRVPRVDGVPALPETDPQSAKRIKGSLALPFEKKVTYRALALPDLPDEQAKTERCGCCDGDGRGCRCRKCGCQCAVCGGTGECTVTQWLSIGIDGIPFRAPLIARIAALPGFELQRPVTDPRKPAVFIFSGGAGVVMPLVQKQAHHIDYADPCAEA
jgi:hypothetical protein